YYFGNREGLQRALLAHMVDTQIPKIKILSQAEGPVEERLRTLIKGWLKGLKELDGLVQIVFTHILYASDEGTERFVREYARPVVNMIRPIIEEGIATGKFRRVEYMFFHLAVVGACIMFVATQPQTAAAYDYHQDFQKSFEGFSDYVANLFVDHLLIKQN